MSGAALVWAANVKGLAPAEKIVLIQLAERHNKDTGRCDPRISLLVEDCEMGRSTVMRHLATLEEKGHLTRVKRGSENGGRSSSQYDLHMGVKSQIGTGVKSHGRDGGKVPFDEGLSPNPDEVKSQQRDPLYKEEPVKNLKEPFLSDFDTFWEVVPRKVAKGKARIAFKAALKKAKAPEIIDGMRRYAATRVGQDEKYTAHPATWLNGEQWADEAPQSNSQHDPEKAARLARYQKIGAKK
ncbi:MAG: helix-turn-helix domain-containing protein [Sulfitobacter sp.]|uniref:helix-turn-helix domain-containing protein n=1 Tax=Alphaproteobacteria TaxID=28211 RepID=UPI002943B8A1|nr:helix-turn-helix domain-containing protein [Sulfitobacter sp. LC.270.F.C4]WOI13522.1 helix-turn-helix domain-containing protein [Sulfitobacter sp. LC.270.F.C4]